MSDPRLYWPTLIATAVIAWFTLVLILAFTDAVDRASLQKPENVVIREFSK